MWAAFAKRCQNSTFVFLEEFCTLFTLTAPLSLALPFLHYISTGRVGGGVPKQAGPQNQPLAGGKSQKTESSRQPGHSENSSLGGGERSGAAMAAAWERVKSHLLLCVFGQSLAMGRGLYEAAGPQQSLSKTACSFKDSPLPGHRGILSRTSVYNLLMEGSTTSIQIFEILRETGGGGRPRAVPHSHFSLSQGFSFSTCASPR